MSIEDVIVIDLPVIILILIRWIVEHFRDRHVDEQLKEITNRVGALRH